MAESDRLAEFVHDHVPRQVRQSERIESMAAYTDKPPPVTEKGH
jgi:hypothetical protein